MIRTTSTFVHSLALASLAFLCACSSSESPAPTATGSGDAGLATEPTATEEHPVDAAPAACVLPKNSKTGVARCDTCLTNKCCIVMHDCFDDAACVKVASCYADCQEQYAPSDPAGAECVKKCVRTNAAASSLLQSALECQSESCAKECKP